MKRVMVAVLLPLAALASLNAQAPGASQAPVTAKTAAPLDLTGYWVSVVNEDWLYRMVTPDKGDYTGVPINAEGRKVADAWDPAKDEATGNQCKAYGAAALMRLPGRLHITWQNDNALRIDYMASTDKGTVINFTNHSYFNLAGNGTGSVADQVLLVNADRYTPAGPDQIPTGEIAPVEGTPLDFRQMMPIGARLHSAFQQMVYAHGYDHNFVLNKPSDGGMTFATRAYDPRTGRIIDCFTTEPGVQIYTSNGMNGSVVGSSGATYRQTEGFTLETQHFPDSPNKPNFPTTALKPGQDFRSTTIFRFATDAPPPPLPR